MADLSRLRGSLVALITPFKNGALDEKAFANLVEWHIGEGSHGLVPCGTTGESPALTHAEHMRLVELCVEVAGGRVPVMAGAGSNATAEAEALLVHARQAGADAALVVTPYYNRPNQAGLLAHYTRLNDAAKGLPIFIYNIPARSAVDMNVETMGALAKLENIVGVKDATGDAARVKAQTAACGADFIQLSGEDATAPEFNAQGGVGCISVSANIAPRLCAKLQNASLAGDTAKAEALAAQLAPLHAAMFCAPSPAPAKYAAMRLGLAREEIRLPLVAASAAERAQIDAALEGLGLPA